MKSEWERPLLESTRPQILVDDSDEGLMGPRNHQSHDPAHRAEQPGKPDL
jgi:hypothetical protein